MKKIIVILIGIILFSCKDDDIIQPDNSNDQISVTPINDTLIVNPKAYSPLTALKQHYTAIKTRAVMTIEGIDANASNYSHDFRTYEQNHELMILGLYPNHTNNINIKYYNSKDELIEEESFTIKTDSMTFTVPTIDVTIANELEMEEGWTLISYRGSLNPNIPIIIDNNGYIRWYLDYTNHSELNTLFFDNGLERLKNGNFYFGGKISNKIYEVTMFGDVINTWGLGKYDFHHNVTETKNGDFIVSVDDLSSTHLNGSIVIEDFFIQIDRISGITKNVWDLKESLDENRTALADKLSQSPVDWFHGNAVIEGEKEGSIIASGRTQGYVYLDKNNIPIWIISTHKGWGTSRDSLEMTDYLLQPLDAAGNPILDTNILNGYTNHPDFEWPWFGHAPLIMPNGNIMVFDNGDVRNYTYAEKYSRAVEYKIDEQNMTIQQVWSYGKARGEDTHSRIVSDVDYLVKSDNVLFSPGFKVPNNNGIGGKVVEIDYSTKDVVFEVEISTTGNLTLHRAERLKLYPN